MATDVSNSRSMVTIPIILVLALIEAFLLLSGQTHG
jgi:hypothetical protein